MAICTNCYTATTGASINTRLHPVGYALIGLGIAWALYTNWVPQPQFYVDWLEAHATSRYLAFEAPAVVLFVLGLATPRISHCPDCKAENALVSSNSPRGRELEAELRKNALERDMPRRK